MFAGAGLAQSANAFRVQAGIEFAFVGIEAGSHANERRGQQSAEQDECGHCTQAPRDFPEQHFPARHSIGLSP
jgi:small neutral amino acid transporter SnatA (MarC family)